MTTIRKFDLLVSIYQVSARIDAVFAVDWSKGDANLLHDKAVSLVHQRSALRSRMAPLYQQFLDKVYAEEKTYAARDRRIDNIMFTLHDGVKKV